MPSTTRGVRLQREDRGIGRTVKRSPLRRQPNPLRTLKHTGRPALPTTPATAGKGMYVNTFRRLGVDLARTHAT